MGHSDPPSEEPQKTHGAPLPRHASELGGDVSARIRAPQPIVLSRRPQGPFSVFACLVANSYSQGGKHNRCHEGTALISAQSSVRTRPCLHECSRRSLAPSTGLALARCAAAAILDGGGRTLGPCPQAWVVKIRTGTTVIEKLVVRRLFAGDFVLVRLCGAAAEVLQARPRRRATPVGVRRLVAWALAQNT